MKTSQTRPPGRRPWPASSLGTLSSDPWDFRKAWQDKRMKEQAKRKPGTQAPQAMRVILPPWPGYPLSGCFPAEPDSVSPGGDIIYCAFRRPTQNQPNAPTGSPLLINVKPHPFTCRF